MGSGVDYSNRSRYQDTKINLILGIDKINLQYSKHKILNFSPFLNDQLLLKETGTLRLPEIDPKVFTNFLVWLDDGSLENSAEITELKEEHEDGKPARRESMNQRWDNLMATYILARKLQCKDFERVVLTEMVSLSFIYDEEFKACIGNENIRDIYPKIKGTELGGLLVVRFLRRVNLTLDTDVFLQNFRDNVGAMFFDDVVRKSIRSYQQVRATGPED